MTNLEILAVFLFNLKVFKIEISRIIVPNTSASAEV